MIYDLRFMNKNRRGFSLIELIVVITIMAVVTVVGVINFSQVNKKSRDSRRISDLEKIRIGLESIRQVGNTYPTALTTLTPNYLQSLPTDPKTGSNYFYSRTAYTYTVGATMEDVGSTNTSNMGYVVRNP